MNHFIKLPIKVVGLAKPYDIHLRASHIVEVVAYTDGSPACTVTTLGAGPDQFHCIGAPAEPVIASINVILDLETDTTDIVQTD